MGESRNERKGKCVVVGCVPGGTEWLTLLDREGEEGPLGKSTSISGDNVIVKP